MRSTSFAVILSLAAAPAFAAPQVVTDLMPTGALVQEVMGDLAQVRVLLPQGTSPHEYQMRPSDAQALQSADLVVWMGPALTPWLGRASENLADSAQLRLLEVEGTALRLYEATEQADDHGHTAEDDHSHSAEDDHGDDDDHADHADSGTDPHAWLNPQNVGPWLNAIVADLSRQDPDNAASYRANADAAAARIAALDATLRDRLAPHAQERFVVFHDAYGYFTDHFGLRPAVPVSLGDASTPSAGRIDQVRGEITRSGAACAFPEFGQNPALIETVIEGSTLRLGGDLSPEGGQFSQGAGQYDAILTHMADTLIACFEGE